jgi:hypothetical protein
VYCFIYFWLLVIFGCCNLEAQMFDNLQDLQEQDFEQFGEEGK